MSTAAAAVSPAESLRRRSREALSALAVQFLLGMAANLIGEPEGTFVIVVDTIIVILHILVAIGLVVIAIRLLLAARKAALGERAALWGLIVIIVTFLAGVGTIDHRQRLGVVRDGRRLPRRRGPLRSDLLRVLPRGRRRPAHLTAPRAPSLPARAHSRRAQDCSRYTTRITRKTLCSPKVAVGQPDGASRMGARRRAAELAARVGCAGQRPMLSQPSGPFGPSASPDADAARILHRLQLTLDVGPGRTRRELPLEVLVGAAR